ncbi:nitroreductase family protein [Prosthecobacter sp.]|uniref:nitroreductase family protein n=1 Tax=Prosthecobacter sp. TaxID=1965333 RepID=UPI003782FFD8
MTIPQAHAGTHAPMSAKDAIYGRRSIRHFSGATVGRDAICMLLDAAVHAPTAMHQEPWGFAVIEDRALLNRLSQSTKEMVRHEALRAGSPHATQVLELVNKPDFHVFYDAPALIVIYGKAEGPFTVADCWLAAQNLMLAACARGLGTCVIGFAVETLNLPEWKAELSIPDGWTAIAPMIVGVPAGDAPPVPRKPPEILTWR